MNEKIVQASPDYPLYPTEKKGKVFVAAQQAIETLITVGRTMGPESVEDEGGKWSYSRATGRGTFYTPFGGDGIASVSFDCGGEIDNNDITKASFVSAFAFWTGNPSGKKPFEFAVIAVPGGQWFDNQGGPTEHLHRQYFFYQEAIGGVLKIEMCGSDEFGWYEPAYGGIPTPGSRVSVGHSQLPAVISRNTKFELEQRRRWGSPQSMRMPF